MKENIIDIPWNYTLYIENGKYLLSVLCGTVGMFEITVVLNKVEKQEFEKSGKEFIENMAFEIRDNPEKWRDRDINNSR